MDNSSYEKLKCIWMASQVVEYKLCDNDFDCENCLFDKAMKNFMNRAGDKIPAQQNVVGDIARKISGAKFDNKIVYLKNNLIAKNICNDTFYFGLNPVLECFLDSETSININENTQRISKGQNIIDISGEWGSVSISSPVDLFIYDRLPYTKENIFKPQWSAIIGDVKKEIINYKSSAFEWENSYNKAAGIIDEIKINEPKIGETMRDGGTMIKFLHQLIGNKKYTDILRAMCS